jgi:uncharacterized membrane protein YadS
MPRDLPQRIGRGALIGAAVGALCIGVGLVRALVAVGFGAHVSALTSGDTRVLVYYVGGFTIAGVLVTTIWPRLTTKFSRYVGFSLAGIVVTLAILVGEKGGLKSLDRVDLIASLLLGILFGCAFAYGYERNPAA